MMVNTYNDPGCRPMSTLNLAGFLAKSEVNGPGTRAVLWVQGCPFRCEGCFNPQFQPFSPAAITRVDILAAEILSLEGLDGVTFSGGEPFAQAGPLAVLGEHLRDAGLTIVTYSGYTPDQLAEGRDPAWPALLAVTDLLIAGPFIAGRGQPDGLRGSTNQQLIPIGTKLSRPRKSGKPEPASQRTEFTITADGMIITTGFPAPTLIRKISPRGREA
jgi:anaerobic ribonucleoside-triphosphate reductase activating protein